MDDDDPWEPDPEPWEPWLSEEEKIERVREVFRRHREQHPRPANAFDTPAGRHARHYPRIRHVSREIVVRELSALVGWVKTWLGVPEVGRRYSPANIYAAHVNGSAGSTIKKLQQVARSHERAGFMVRGEYIDLLRMLQGEGAEQWPDGLKEGHLQELQYRERFFAKPESKGEAEVAEPDQTAAARSLDVVELFRMAHPTAKLQIALVKLVETRRRVTHQEVVEEVYWPQDKAWQENEYDPGWEAIKSLTKGPNRFFAREKLGIKYKCGAACITREERPD